MQKNLILQIIIFCLFITGLVFLLHQKSDRDYQTAKANFIQNAEQDAKVLAQDVDTKLKSIYQNIRTISVTPQVRKIDRHATNFNEDGRFFIQQIYNNLMFAVNVSEVYIVSKTFDGEKIDPVTGELELPNTMFDDLITGLSADKKTVVNEDLHNENKHEELEKAEEVEIYEFRNVKNQIATFGKLYKNLADIKTLDNIPCMVSPGLITCDNTYFEKTRNDLDRTGIMMTVPFYNPKDEFEGVVSAIILLNNMRQWLPNHNYGLANPAYNLAIHQTNDEDPQNLKNWVQAGQDREDLIFTYETKLSVPDIKGAWTLRAGLPNSDFLESQEVQSINQFTYAGYVIIFFISLLIFAIRRAMNEAEHSKELLQENKSLQNELVLSAHRSGMADVATSVLHNVGNVLNSINTSVSMVQQKVTDSNVSNISKVAEMITTNQEKLDTFLTEDPQGKLIPGYINKLSEKWGQDKAYLLNEIKDLHNNVTHIKDIITRQNNNVETTSVMTEDVIVSHLIEDALKLNAASFLSADIHVSEDYQTTIEAHLDRIKLMQILVNIVKNAYEALLFSSTQHKELTVTLKKKDQDHFIIQIQDNGVGIAPENLTHIASQGFTTKKDGHGFGLHTSALALQQMGGDLKVESDGLGKGALFTIVLPYKQGQKT